MCKCICKRANSVFFIHAFAKRSNGVFRAKWALNSVDTSLRLSPPLPYCLCWTLPQCTIAVPQSHSAPQHHRTPIAWSVSQWPLPRYNVLVPHGIACHLMLLHGIAWHLMLLHGNGWHLMLLYGNAVVTRPNFRKAQLGRRESDKVQSYSYGFHMDHLCGMANTQIHKYTNINTQIQVLYGLRTVLPRMFLIFKCHFSE